MRVRWFLLGVLSSLAIAGIGAAVVLRNARGFSAREKPSAYGGVVCSRGPVGLRSGGGTESCQS